MKTALTLEHLLEVINKRGKPARTLPPIPKRGGIIWLLAYRPGQGQPMSRGLLSMECESVGYGLVLHLACGRLAKEGIFSVSDPETGARVALGESPGRDAALDALAASVRQYYMDHPRGDYRRALKAAREIFISRLNFFQQKPGKPS